LPGSPAINAGGGAACPETDQRGVLRPVPAGGTCDVGAFEYDLVPQVKVDNSSPADSAQVPFGINSLKVVFNKDVSAATANNTANYLLMEENPTAGFQTVSCKGGPAAVDTSITINNASYNPATTIATLTVNGGVALPIGSYRLFVCGTTSIIDPYGLKLNYGLSDTTISFRIVAATAVSASLPSTGFAPNRRTVLPPQTVFYAGLGDLWLEIPSQNIKANIVGVPQTNSGWDVTWLGNDIGWLNGTAFPTWAGNSVLTGHVWNANNTPGVFVNLKSLKYGDQVRVHAFGQVSTYEVRENRTVWPSQVDIVLQHKDLPTLTLLTCEDYRILWGTYSVRRMVRAVLVSVAAEK